jgi:glycosyltransferase 2 family protein
VKRLISIGVSLAILVVIYWKIDLAKLMAVFGQCDRLWLAISLAMVVPITLVTAWRLQQLMPRSIDTKTRGLSFAEANRLILAASVLNMVLPSKMGDIAKAYFMRDRGQLDGSLALSLVVFEKACDMLSLLLWCTVGLLLFPRRDLLFGVMTIAIGLGLILGLLMLGSIGFARAGFDLGRRLLPGKLAGKIDPMAQSWEQMHDYFWSDRRRLLTVSATSVFIWFLHLLQIWFFIVALRASVPLLTSLALSPLAILAGLLPLTFAGVGTRDAALIAFYGPYFPAATGAALGVLCTSRYLMPAIGGLPFLNRYLGLVKRGSIDSPNA